MLNTNNPKEEGKKVVGQVARVEEKFNLKTGSWLEIDCKWEGKLNFGTWTSISKNIELIVVETDQDIPYHM